MKRTFDKVIYWVVIPIAIGCSVFYVVQGSILAVVSISWTVTLWLNAREYRGWRDRTNAYAHTEKKDRARFAIDVLQLKSKVAFSSWNRYKVIAAHDQEVLDGVLQLYQDVADTWIPSDADEKYHVLKRAAARVVETGRPERVLH